MISRILHFYLVVSLLARYGRLIRIVFYFPLSYPFTLHTHTRAHPSTPCTRTHMHTHTHTHTHTPHPQNQTQHKQPLQTQHLKTILPKPHPSEAHDIVITENSLVSSNRPTAPSIIVPSTSTPNSHTATTSAQILQSVAAQGASVSSPIVMTTPGMVALSTSLGLQEWTLF